MRLDRDDTLSHRFGVPATPERARTSPIHRSWAATCLLVLRTLALLMTIELSGAAHLMLDTCEKLGVVDQHQAHDDCDDEEAGHECPPGCLNCHCAHAAVLIVAASPLAVSRRASTLEPRQAAFPSRALVYPGATDLESIYRPPRSLV